MKNNLKYFARNNRKTPTKAEGLFWHMIVKKRLTGYRFIRQKILGNYIVDFYCPKLKLVVELDGSSHINQEDLDINRMSFLEKKGLKIIRYTNDLVENQLEGVYYHLLENLKEREKELKKNPSA